MMYNYYNGYFSPFHFVSSLIGWIVVFLIIMFVIRVVRGGRRHHHCEHCDMHGEGHGRGLDILKERYAKGEIDKKEFEEKKKDLMS